MRGRGIRCAGREGLTKDVGQGARTTLNRKILNVNPAETHRRVGAREQIGQRLGRNVRAHPAGCHGFADEGHEGWMKSVVAVFVGFGESERFDPRSKCALARRHQLQTLREPIEEKGQRVADSNRAPRQVGSCTK